MTTKKAMARAARKSAKVIAMAAATTAAVINMTPDRLAYEQAMADMADEYGKENVCRIAYMEPLGDGFIA